MKTRSRITTLFLDIGGVLLTNGWDHEGRQRAAKLFHLDLRELEDRHHLIFDTYETGKLSLDTYLANVVFYQKRPFTVQQFRSFMFGLSESYPEMIGLVGRLKEQYQLKVAVVSNEGRELTLHRIRKFELNGFVDFFVCSCFVHCRKPDADIYRLALDIAQVRPSEVVYIEDRPLFVRAAESVGLKAVHHVGYESTRADLANFGLRDT